MESFNIDQLSNPDLGAYYDLLAKRFSDIACITAADHGLNNRKIAFSFAPSNQANARASKTSSGYDIKISSALPQALRLLFARLLSDPEVMPWLPADHDKNTDLPKIDLSIGAQNLEQIKAVPFKGGVERVHMAEIFADVAISYVFMHELGHILAGHLDLPGPNVTSPSIEEFSLVELMSPEPSERSRAWEYEADVVGSGLMNSQVDVLITQAKRLDAESSQIFGPAEIAVEQCLSTVIIALYVLFRDLRGANHELNLNGNHPYPLIRAFCVRDALFQATAKRHPINRDLLEELTSARFEEFDDALERVGVNAGMLLNDTAIEEINQQMSALIRSRRKFRHITRAHRYIDWD